jgi:hypothetical protein
MQFTKVILAALATVASANVINVRQGGCGIGTLPQCAVSSSYILSLFTPLPSFLSVPFITITITFTHRFLSRRL